MLLVSARKGPSSIHGIGLIAAEQISAGTEVWRFMPGFDVVVPETRLPTLSPNARQQLIYYAYFHTRTRTYVLSGDDDRFTNHSAEPNTEAAGYYTVARRDIAAGEEITVNYDSMSALAWWATDTDTSSCELVSERRP